MPWSARAIGALLLLLGAGCTKRPASEEAPERVGPRVPPSAGSLRIRSILARLAADAEPTRAAALEELRELSGVTAAEALQLLRATTRAFPALPAESWDAQSWLVHAAGRAPHAEHAAVVERLFPSWSLTARERGLELLAQIEDPNAAEGLMRLLGAHGETLRSSPLGPLQRAPRHAEVFFPGLLGLAAHEALSDDVYLTALHYCQAGLLRAEAFAAHAPALAAAYAREAEWLAPRQRETGAAWMWEEEYYVHRRRAAILLDLFGYVGLEHVEPALRAALVLRDPRLVYFGALSLARHGEMVAPELFSRLAASPEVRVWLRAELAKLERSDLFPAEHDHQVALAESELVVWLTHPSELGRTPDEIRFGKLVPIETDDPDGPLDYYVFKFRTHKPHWAARYGWMAGIAGPYLRGRTPTHEAQGGTFSSFDPWGARTPEGHVAELRALHARWAEERAGGE